MISFEKLKNNKQYINLVARWLHDAFGHYNPMSMKARIIKLNSLSSDFIILIKDNKPIGCASLVIKDIKLTPYSPLLASMYVLPEERMNGYASLLTSEICKMAINKQFKKVYLYTTDKQNLYMYNGFKKEKDLILNSIKITLMSKNLS